MNPLAMLDRLFPEPPAKARIDEEQQRGYQDSSLGRRYNAHIDVDDGKTYAISCLPKVTIQKPRSCDDSQADHSAKQRLSAVLDDSIGMT